MNKLQKILLVVIVIGLGLVFTQRYWVGSLTEWLISFDQTENQQQIVGGDKDEHGCILSAGYSWCEEKQKCLRPWEEVCEDLIRVSNPQEGQVIKSPLNISGEARGTWYFEATFPIVLVDWDGKIIAEHYAQAKGDWMTEDFVPFEATLEFENPYKTGNPEYMKKGTLILKKDNPSGLPENDAAIEIPILFE